MRILLARHGETQWNVEGRCQGQGFDIPLSDPGRDQAMRLGARLAGLPIRKAVASPLLRARQTAELALGERLAERLADQAGFLTFDDRLMEICHGRWEGLVPSEIRAGYPELHRAWRETPHLVQLPEGESLAQVEARAWAGLVSACSGLGPDDVVLIVTHDAVNRTLLCRILGLPLARVWAFRQAPTCLNLLEGNDLDQLQVVRLNDAAHLTPLFGEGVHRRL
ncbi:MAG: histidine phosphatase family protein [Holophaga sp.]|jgi:probable phosphoglycerate mutase